MCWMRATRSSVACSLTNARSRASLSTPRDAGFACATYGSAALWFARIEGQKPTLLKWAGSHVAAAFSPDGKFLISAMQENALHGWRVADAKDMRMGGYPAKPRSLAFLAHDALLAARRAAEGADGLALLGANGPMGRPGGGGRSPKKARGSPGWRGRQTGRSWPQAWTTAGSGSPISPPRGWNNSARTRARRSRPWPCPPTRNISPGAMRTAKRAWSIRRSRAG